MGISISGVHESTIIASGIFVLHLAIMTLVIVWGFVYGFQNNFSILFQNMHTNAPLISTTSGNYISRRNPAAALYFGYCSGLLGITGFETAANYVEEMKCTRTFVEVVHWMW
jgi:amino acid transporter